MSLYPVENPGELQELLHWREDEYAMSGTCIAKPLTAERKQYSHYSSLEYQQHQKTRTVSKAESSNPKVLSLGVSLLCRAAGIHPHYWPVPLLTQLCPEVKAAQAVLSKEWSTQFTLHLSSDNPAPKGECVPALNAGWHLSPGLGMFSLFLRYSFLAKGGFAFLKES